MRQFLASAWVIARRDYGATVFSKVFILFLLTPLFSLAFGAVFALAGHDDGGPGRSPMVAVIGGEDFAHPLIEARTRLAKRLGDDAVPTLRRQAMPASGFADGPHEAREALRNRDTDAAVSGTLDRPLVTVVGDDRGLADRIGLILDAARAGPPATARIDVRYVAQPAAPDESGRRDVAHWAQTGVFFLLMLLAGMSLSTFIEEKSNKVIEVLAAAVPIDAIFLGKLVAMLAISLTGVAIWAGAALTAVMAFFPHALSGATAPAVGWPLFIGAAILYFTVSYLLIGAVFLGLGSQAGSPREVQSMAMPVTMLQLLLFGFASAGTAHPNGWIGIASAVFPWSSPLSMLGRAALVPSLWPHLLALAWQLLWLVLALRVAAAMFRRAVLKSGGGWRWPWMRKAQ
ncbi:ABC transporter permease [Sphingomonas sp. CGMCC 1.13654]|uniref:ABC transporter permease n=1 Tax=Sphingomonas chungangi TaxID=2683589 RepID=A0A838L832_9SPHN|nr:ABC transporter permease [Sphingomonas chungangi]MBA2934855.1 ABC transporter permease [Sphingomonas chungangi]MVW58166.1 ABC transporter permease [Sphingomonas chungangi]